MRQEAQSERVQQFTTVVNADAAEKEMAQRIATQIRRKPDSVLGLATGNSMVGVYDELAQMHARDELSFSQVTSFNLDEYCGVPPKHPASFASYMSRHFLSRVDMKSENMHLPDPAQCEAYEAAIAVRGIDLQILGIGRNGHIGFNEPGSAVTSRTRIVRLTQDTRDANRQDFPSGETVPEKAVTMGLETILSARRILMLVTGEAKAAALAEALEGPIGSHNPASFLRLHRRAEIICDAAAASALAQPLVSNHA